MSCRCAFPSECSCEFFRPRQVLRQRPTPLVTFKPMASEALAVHPSQIPEAIEHAKKSGVPMNFDSEGRPQITSSRQFRRYAKSRTYVHRGYA